MDYLKQETAQTTTAATTAAPAETTTTAAAASDFSDSYAGTYRVTASALNLRSGPSTANSKVGTIPGGTTIEVTSANGKWAAVSYNGVSGYCSMDYLKQEAAQTTTAASEAQATTTTETTTTAAAETTTEAAATTMDTNVDDRYVTLYGDINCDGMIDITDAVMLQKHLNGSVSLNYAQLANADCQKDEQIDATDVVVPMQFLLNSFTSLPVV